MSMNNKYLIALDLDGTLLNDKKDICFLTKKYLHKLNKKGIYVVLCSGRAPRTMLRYYDELKLNSPMISYNGALTFSPYDSSFEQTSYKFDYKILKEIYPKLTSFVDSTMSENEKTIFIDKEDHFLFTFFERNNLEVKKGPLNEVLDADVYTYVIRLKDNATSETKHQELLDLTKSLTSLYRLRFWHDCAYAEFHFQEVSKAHALKNLATKLNVPFSNVLVFGDAENDVEMLSEFENSFFMKNGNPLIRNAAKNVTKKDNNHNGIKVALKEFFKNYHKSNS